MTVPVTEATTAEHRERAERADRDDPLRAFISRFQTAPAVVNLDGNSLGSLPQQSVSNLYRTVVEEWGFGLIRSWEEAGWLHAPARIGDKIGRLLGASPGETLVSDSTSVNLFKLLMAALQARPQRKVVVSERGNFPTDLYVAQGVVDLLGGDHTLRLVDSDDELLAAIDSEVAVVMLTQVDYRSGRLLDMLALTERAHDVGALALWDLCHSAGAVPLDLTACDVDLAVGCGYKYLNGGPGAPAYLFVRHDLQGSLASPVPGWMGHLAPFEMIEAYEPAAGIQRFLTGTPPVIALAALEAAIDLWLEVDQLLARQKAVSLSEFFLEITHPLQEAGVTTLVSPPDPRKRGNHVALAHPRALQVIQTLAQRGVLADFRPPDIMRFGFAPLYLTYADVLRGAHQLMAVALAAD